MNEKEKCDIVDAMWMKMLLAAKWKPAKWDQVGLLWKMRRGAIELIVYPDFPESTEFIWRVSYYQVGCGCAPVLWGTSPRIPSDPATLERAKEIASNAAAHFIRQLVQEHLQ